MILSKGVFIVDLFFYAAKIRQIIEIRKKMEEKSLAVTVLSFTFARKLRREKQHETIDRVYTSY
jgi:hypothetical protein